MIATQFNFQDLNVIDKTISMLLKDESFFKKFNKRIEYYEQKKDESNFKFEWEEFQELFDFRHKIVHSMKNSNNISLHKINRWFDLTNFFLMESSIILMKKRVDSSQNSSEEKENEHIKLDLISTEMMKASKSDNRKLKFDIKETD